MIPKMKIKQKGHFRCLVLSLLVFVYLSPIHGQVTRDHRTNTKTIDKSQVLYFDEADAFIGKRTEIKKAHPTFRVTGKVNTIDLPQELIEGDNHRFKMKSGHTLYATVKKGKVIKIGRVKEVSSNTRIFTEPNPNSTCFNCMEICLYPADRGPKDCWTICEVVDCSKEYNAQIQGQSAPTPSPAGPTPIPYPNISTQDITNKGEKRIKIANKKRKN